MHRLRRLCQWLLGWRYPAVLIGLGLLLSLPSLWNGIQLDDITLQTVASGGLQLGGLRTSPWALFTFLDGDPQRTRLLVDYGLIPWWTDPHCRIAFWRPLTVLTHLLDFRVWPEWPLLMHAQSLAWFALLIWAVAIFYRRMIRRAAPVWAAALAGLLFAVDDAHAMPVGWLANRNALLATLFGVLALICHDRWRRDGWRVGGLLAPLALLAGLLAKESTVSAGGYLLAYAIFLDRGRWTGRLCSLLPYALLALVWYTVYETLGFGVIGSGVYVDLAHDPIGFLQHVVSDGPILMLGQWGLPPSDVTTLYSTSVYQVQWVFAVVFLVLLCVLIAPLLARDALARFWTLGMILSLLPACLAFPMDRLLMYVGLGAMGLLAQWLGGLAEGAPWVPRRAAWRRLAAVSGPVLVGIHLIVAPLLLPVMVNLPRAMGGLARPLWVSFPTDHQLQDQMVVTVNPTSVADDFMKIQLQLRDGRPSPARSLVLCSSFSAASLTRTDANTLVVRPRGGYLPPRGRTIGGELPSSAVSPFYVARLLDLLVRGNRNPLRLGETIELSAATITITELTADGRPAAARFRFPLPLEDPSIRWFQVAGDRYVPFDPPAIGETVEVPMVAF